MYTKEIFDIRPGFEAVVAILGPDGGREPSLTQIVRKYYSDAGLHNSEELTKQYFALLQEKYNEIYE